MTTVQLSEKQKQFILDYLLCFSKGIVECEEFWEGISQEEIDNNYDAWRDKVEDFIEETKHHLETTT